MSLGHSVAKKKESFKEWWDVSQGHKCQLEGAPSGHIGDRLRIKINDDNNRSQPIE